MNSSELWTAFAAGDSSARDALVAEHLGLVHFVARQIFRTLSSEAEFEELLSAGTLGLIGAFESFDRTRGLAFSTFAAPRIRGSILDELRRQDHVSRSVRRKARELGAAGAELTRVLGRPPVDGELAAELDVDVAQVWRWRTEIEGVATVSLDRASADSDGRAVTLADTLADEQPSIDELLNHEQEVAQLKLALLALNEQERTVLSLCYYEELKLHEIATVLEVTESRVSQIRTRALGRLRAAMQQRVTGVA